jgi:hypothetical protein
MNCIYVGYICVYIIWELKNGSVTHFRYSVNF